MAVLRTATNFYKPRKGEPIANALAYARRGSGGAGGLEDAELTVLLPTRYIAFDSTRDEASAREFMATEDFQVTYSFSRNVRNNVFSYTGAFAGVRARYGGDKFTFRQLYDFLCTHFNSGERFVDTYFQQVFPYSPVGRDLKSFEADTRDALNNEYYDRTMAALARKTTKAGLPNMATREGRYLKDFDVWKQAVVRERLGKFRADVRQEIIASLSTGRIPLQHINNPETMAYRAKLGLDSRHVFFASGQLIRDIQIDIRMPENSFA